MVSAGSTVRLWVMVPVGSVGSTQKGLGMGSVFPGAVVSGSCMHVQGFGELSVLYLQYSTWCDLTESIH